MRSDDEQSAVQESFVGGLLDCPHYTRPEVYEALRVPEVLLSGHHAEIERWRLKARARQAAWLRRPELLGRRGLERGIERTLHGGVPPGARRKRSMTMDLIRQLEQEEIKRLGQELPVFAPGDTVIVNVNV